jgi:dUTP pyrophosphatase
MCVSNSSGQRQESWLFFPSKEKGFGLFKITNASENTIFYATTSSAGFDISANENSQLLPGEWKLIKTGLKISEVLMPSNMASISSFEKVGKILPEIQIRPRSGLAAKFGVTLLNSPATIDADYRGEIQVILINHGKEVFNILKGDRIAQAVVSLVMQPLDIPVKKQERGQGGFGSSGVGSV